MKATRRSALLAIAGGVGLSACARPFDPVAADVRWALERTVPPGGRLTVSFPLRRGHDVARASWEIETSMDWEAYAAWVEPQLGGYRLAQPEAHTLRFSRSLEGDVFVIVLARKAGPESRTVEASFESRPF